MSTVRHLFMGLAAACALAVVVAGCTEEQPEASRYPDLTLRESKTSAQLLRNEVASRIPAEVVEAVGEAVDESVACLSEKEDADGTIRSWQSTATVALHDAAASGVDGIIDGVAESFTGQGWKLASLEGSAVIHTRYLSKDTTAAIDLSAISDDEDAMYVPSAELETASVVIVVHGPCVVTEGADSEEVMSLESR